MLLNPLRPTLLVLLTISFSFIINAQRSLKPKMSKGNTYAVIIGISDYQNENIRDLKYAHNDAHAFADYLSSAAGGNVVSDNISFMVNENATISNIYTAIANVKDKANENDLIYFYFSGHGVIEEGLYKKGFFLGYDSPFKNYLTNSLRIEDLNQHVNEISILKGAKVVLVTDACHSGRISGQDLIGNRLIGEQLSKAEKNEVRLASCESDQKSQEGEAWGNGRGVFSYYLVNGLMGLADMGEQDGVVSLNEIRMYLENNIPRDVQKVKQVDQVPVINGKGLSTMAIVDVEIKKKIIEEVDLGKNEFLASKSIYEPSAADIYFDNLTKFDLYNNYDFTEWQGWKAKKVIKKAIKEFKSCETKEVKKSKWRKSLKKDKKAKKEYGLRLASILHNNVQPTVNSYLDGTPQSFNSQSELDALLSQLDRCVKMLNVAHKLIDKDDYLYKIIGVKKHWINAIYLRLKGAQSKDPEKAIKESKKELAKALEYEEKAKYINVKMEYETTTTRTTGAKTRTRTYIRRDGKGGKQK